MFFETKQVQCDLFKATKKAARTQLKSWIEKRLDDVEALSVCKKLLVCDSERIFIYYKHFSFSINFEEKKLELLCCRKYLLRTFFQQNILENPLGDAEKSNHLNCSQETINDQSNYQYL